jgi:hypothetical protein
MGWFTNRKKLHNNAASSPKKKEVEAAEEEHRKANQAYIKAEHDGAPSDKIREAEQQVQRTLKHLDALTGTYRPRRRQ